MSLDQFYSLSGFSMQQGKVSAEIILNRDHAIYEGHFPGNPVTPGVCQLQIIKDVMGEVLGSTCYLSEAKNIKFLNILTPVNSGVRLELEYSESGTGVKVNAVLSAGKTIFLKFTGTFLKELAGFS